MEPTPHPSLNALLRALADGQRGVLGDRLVSLCLQGSFAIGDADEHSDVDWLAIIGDELTDADVERLQALHTRIYDGDWRESTADRRWNQYLEGSYMPRAVLHDLDRRGDVLWYLDNGARQLVRATHCNTAVTRVTFREHGIVLTGAAPSTLFPPLPVDALRAEMVATMRDWAAEIIAAPERYRNRFYQGFIVLSYCRMWCDVVTGGVGSKRRGAEWAKPRLDPAWTDLIDRAWMTRPDPSRSVREPADSTDFERTLQLMQHIVDQL